MSYRFHASAPPGEWINDPNALLFADGRYHLYVQHAADAPAFRQVGWGHLSSPDLMDWRWDGVALPPGDDASAYSGSLIMAEPPELFYTRHDPTRPWQEQARARLAPDFAHAEPLAGSFGPVGRNVRDPFVWRSSAGWRMLVARPCDWTDWRDDSPSTLELWGSPDREDWSLLATIGPCMPPGVMWEVPALIDFGGTQALILSLVDRRADTADCAVRYWLGRMTDTGFVRRKDFPSGGVPLDLGPDFYAAIPNIAQGWPTSDRMVTGWASSWRTAREVGWPDNRGGGPIAMPRNVVLRGERLIQSPGIARRPDHIVRLAPGAPLRLTRGDASLIVVAEHTGVTASRQAGGFPPFRRRAALPPSDDWDAMIFIDDLLVELFWRGAAITAALPGKGPTRLST